MAAKDTTQTRLTVYLPREFFRRLKARAAREGRTLSDLVLSILRNERGE